MSSFLNPAAHEFVPNEFIEEADQIEFTGFVDESDVKEMDFDGELDKFLKSQDQFEDDVEDFLKSQDPFGEGLWFPDRSAFSEKKVDCKFGVGCKNPKCRFGHPERN